MINHPKPPEIQKPYMTPGEPSSPQNAPQHTVDLLEEALQVAQRQGYSVRRQWMAENLGGPCRIGDTNVLYINLSLPAAEQLQHALLAIGRYGLPPGIRLSKVLGNLLRGTSAPDGP